MKRLASLLCLLLALLAGPGALAQNAPRPHAGKPASEAPSGGVHLSAALTASETTNIKGGLHWRVFEEKSQADEPHRLVAELREAAPSFALPDGTYIVHAAFGLAGATKRIVVEGRYTHEVLILNAGGLKLIDKLGDATLPPQRLAISIYVPERDNSEAKLVLANARAGEVISLPEGPYHIVATLLDASGAAWRKQCDEFRRDHGSARAGGQAHRGDAASSRGDDHAEARQFAGRRGAGQHATRRERRLARREQCDELRRDHTDLRVPAGKLIEATLRHRAATITLKLVNSPGGEALANTSFSVLTPGGDVIRELIGAFPSLVLAEGEYVAIARHDGKTYQNSFKVVSTKDSDVEIVVGKSLPKQPDSVEPEGLQ